MSDNYNALLDQFGPLLEVQEAELILTTSRESIRRLIDAGTLLVCDIGLGKKQRAIRIFKHSLARLLAGEKGQPPIAVPIEWLLPHHRPHFFIRELATFLRCTDQHIRNLADLGELPKLPAAPDGVIRFSRQSVIEFVQWRAS
jgi:hypothetical protein